MKKLFIISFILIPFSLLYAEEKTSSIDEVCEDLKSDIFFVHDGFKEADDMDTSEWSDEEQAEFQKLYMELLEVQLANTKMFSDLRCEK